MIRFNSYSEITFCRLCESVNLEEVWDLGLFALTSVFPSSANPQPRIPIVLMKCQGECGLLQLKHSTNPELLFSNQYGYRSSINSSMKSHLQDVVTYAESFKNLAQDDIVVDIGSNDGTTLNFFSRSGLKKVGFDPSPMNWGNTFYKESTLINEFFSADTYDNLFTRRAKLILSLAMFYDVENPKYFAKQVARILDDDGLWIIEQSYVAQMIKKNSFDTLCHEHVAFYGISQINYLAQAVGLKIVDVKFNDSNGGSFVAVLCKETSHQWKHRKYNSAQVISEERDFLTERELFSFKRRVEELRSVTISTLQKLKAQGPLAALGASTKGNVLLQYYGIDSSLIEQIGEVFPNKFNHFTPGSNIPIVDETQILNHYNHIFVLPWHFRDTFIKKNYKSPSVVVFSLPNLEILQF